MLANEYYVIRKMEVQQEMRLTFERDIVVEKRGVLSAFKIRELFIYNFEALMNR